ncbi:uncharacterized protein LOC134190904 isoform X2 [Corticium candelabrum]|uniref:uncharacterized protein LOC134190904 isoform X2 n=1 Tax=Corticium candelabrum TaxID=121492 RepID=UPI002E26E034|nr:uncharacterized protein LOC134190904 isoform X2 [Corticium candelabrum]
MAALLGYLFARERREVYHDVNPDCRKLVHGPLTSDLMRRCRHILAHRTDQVDSQTQLDFNDIMRVLKDLNMTPSRAQVEEMLQFAAECSGRPTSTYLTFGELCLFAVDLQGSSDGGSSDYHFDKVVHRRKRLQSANPDIGVRYQVFLGGSCNPTTWRCDIVIPILEEAGVTFYNPQVDRWCDGLIEVEEQAKQSADLCLFVIDNQTRGVASMVEAAYLAASGHPIILVMVDFGENVEIEGIPLSPRELQDLNRGRIFVSNLMAWQGLPIFTDIATAARACCKVLNSGISVTSLGPSDGAQPAKLTGASVGRKLLAVHEAFSHCKLLQLSTVSRKEVSLVLRSLCLPNVEAECDINSVLPCPHDDGDESYDFNEFCSLAAEMMSQD